VEAQSSYPPYDEAEAQAIDRMLMCPVCPAETIDQAQVELARQMRQVVREMLVAGASREEILKFFVDRYGPDILAAPPKTGFNLLAWLFPAVGAVAALGTVWLVLRSMTARRGGEPAAEPQTEADLEPYLATVDRELAGSEKAGLRPWSGGSDTPHLSPSPQAGRNDGRNDG
jgi:cytochrome c-type biogenesis protein CcmH